MGKVLIDKGSRFLEMYFKALKCILLLKTADFREPWKLLNGVQRGAQA